MNSTDRTLEKVATASHAVEAANKTLDDAVQSARAAGATWQQVGNVLGMSKQAASQRFHVPTSGFSTDTLEQIQKELRRIAEEAFTALAHSDFEHLHSLMTYLTARQLSKRKISKVWEQVTENVGLYIEVNNSVIETNGSGYVLTYRLDHHHGQPVGQIAFNSRKQITGLVIYLDDSAELPW